METRRCPGRVASGMTRVVAKGTSKGDRAASRVTVTETGFNTVRVVLSAAAAALAGFVGAPCARTDAKPLAIDATAAPTAMAAAREIR